MYDYFKRIEKEFIISQYINNEKIEKARDKKLSVNSLNSNERQVLNYGYSYIMLAYNTEQQGLISYYIVEFNSSKIIDILKINIIERQNSGFFIHSVKSSNSVSDKEINFEKNIKSILEKDMLICEFGPLGYSEHADLAYIIDPKRNNLEYFIK